MEANVKVERIKDQPPLRIYLEYESDYVVGDMVIEECTTQPSEMHDSDDLVFTTRQDAEFTFWYRGGEATIGTGGANDFPDLALPSGPSAVLDESLRQLCERE